MSRKKPAPAPAAKSSPELDLIRTLAGILNETGLSEIELDQKGTRVRVSRSLTAVASVTAPPPVHAPAAHYHGAPAPAAAAKALDSDHPGTVKSPMVGTVYRASGQDSAAFVEVGSEVKQGQTLLIIEAMKTMNQIPAPRAGRITHVFVENGQPVEFGEPLVAIE
ncbi:MAG: acetyl-CoA carboxylase biotin carboxyl carrier protein [Hyphomicrobiales bacterium]